MKLIITGSNGLLGQKIVKLCLQRKIDFLATSAGANRNSSCPKVNYMSMDITHLEQIEKVMNTYYPTHVLHTAAMTNVDECENKPDECREINVLGTAKLWEVCKEREIHFQLLSTDFVFDGENGPYKETDPVGPLSIYAQSKVDAENLLLNDPNNIWSIVRTIIVYGTGENLSRSNIILWAREALQTGNPLNIVDDQFRSPTWADDLAWACVEIAERKKTGIFHISGPVTFSIIDLVKEIANFYNLPLDNIRSVSSSTLNKAAKRPPKTGFILDKAYELLDYKPLTIKDSLRLLEEELKKS
jgi:dTDP-4-dehydrorhamnose reductase